jgi:hypothetical protein
METTIRPARATDAAECGRIIYAAFTDIADRHGFSRPFPSPEVATGLATMRLTNPGFYGVVAEEAGNIVGSISSICARLLPASVPLRLIRPRKTAASAAP